MFGAKFEISSTKWVEKTLIYIFFHFWFKNKQVWAEKTGNKQKNSKNLKVANNLSENKNSISWYMINAIVKNKQQNETKK